MQSTSQESCRSSYWLSSNRCNYADQAPASPRYSSRAGAPFTSKAPHSFDVRIGVEHGRPTVDEWRRLRGLQRPFTHVWLLYVLQRPFNGIGSTAAVGQDRS